MPNIETFDNWAYFRAQGHKNDCPEEDLQEYLLQESPETVFDRKLIINNICIRSIIEKWRESSKYVEEIHKQEYV